MHTAYTLAYTLHAGNRCMGLWLLTTNGRGPLPCPALQRSEGLATSPVFRRLLPGKRCVRVRVCVCVRVRVRVRVRVCGCVRARTRVHVPTQPDKVCVAG